MTDATLTAYEIHFKGKDEPLSFVIDSRTDYQEPGNSPLVFVRNLEDDSVDRIEVDERDICYTRTLTRPVTVDKTYEDGALLTGATPTA